MNDTVTWQDGPPAAMPAPQVLAAIAKSAGALLVSAKLLNVSAALPVFATVSESVDVVFGSVGGKASAVGVTWIAGSSWVEPLIVTVAIDWAVFWPALGP